MSISGYKLSILLVTHKKRKWNVERNRLKSGIQRSNFWGDPIFGIAFLHQKQIKLSLCTTQTSNVSICTTHNQEKMENSAID
jgi:hypothetical protein